MIASAHTPQSFLSSLDPPLSIPEEKVLRWHPAFPLEHIPDVEPATLPRPPVTGEGNVLCVFFIEV